MASHSDELAEETEADGFSDPSSSKELEVLVLLWKSVCISIPQQGIKRRMSSTIYFPVAVSHDH